MSRRSLKQERKEPQLAIQASKYSELVNCNKIFNDAVMELSRTKEAFEKEKKIMEKYKFDDIIELNVGGCRFTTYKSTLLSPLTEGSMLSAMFSGRHELKKDSNGCCFIDRPSAPFQFILDSLRTGELIMPSSPTLHQQVLIELAYYGLENQFFDSLYSPPMDTAINIDDESREVLFAWLGGNKSLKLIYRYSKDNSNFHTLCDRKSPTLIVYRSKSGHVFGGYTECKWDQSSSYKNGNSTQSSWLFTLVLPTGGSPKRYYANSTANQIYCHTSYGPTFGAGHEICTPIGSSTMTFNPSTYPINDGYLTGSSSAEISEYEVFLVETVSSVKVKK